MARKGKEKEKKRKRKGKERQAMERKGKQRIRKARKGKALFPTSSSSNIGCCSNLQDTLTCMHDYYYEYGGCVVTAMSTVDVWLLL